MSGGSLRNPRQAAHQPEELFKNSGFNPHDHFKNPIRKYSNAKLNNKGSMFSKFSLTFNKHVSDRFGDHPLDKEDVGPLHTYVRGQPSLHIKNNKPAWPANIPTSIKEHYTENQPDINDSSVRKNANMLNDQRRASPSVKEVLKKLNDKVNKLYS